MEDIENVGNEITENDPEPEVQVNTLEVPHFKGEVKDLINSLEVRIKNLEDEIKKCVHAHGS